MMWSPGGPLVVKQRGSPELRACPRAPPSRHHPPFFHHYSPLSALIWDPVLNEHKNTHLPGSSFTGKKTKNKTKTEAQRSLAQVLPGLLISDHLSTSGLSEPSPPAPKITSFCFLAWSIGSHLYTGIQVTNPRHEDSVTHGAVKQTWAGTPPGTSAPLCVFEVIGRAVSTNK